MQPTYTASVLWKQTTFPGEPTDTTTKKQEQTNKAQRQEEVKEKRHDWKLLAGEHRAVTTISSGDTKRQKRTKRKVKTGVWAGKVDVMDSASVLAGTLCSAFMSFPDV